MFGVMQEVLLKPGGAGIPVTDQNKVGRPLREVGIPVTDQSKVGRPWWYQSPTRIRWVAQPPMGASVKGQIYTSVTCRAASQSHRLDVPKSSF